MKADLLRSRQRLVSMAILGCSAALLVLIGVALYAHPAAAGTGNFSPAVIILAAVAVSGAATIWTFSARATSLQMALVIGAAAGAVDGLIEMANIAFEYSTYGSRAVHTVAVPVSMALMILVFSGAGSLAYEHTSSIRLATISGVWCAVVATILTCTFGFGYNFFQMPHMVEIMQPEFARSGLGDAQAYVWRNTIESASMHFLLAPLLGTVAGFIGGFISAQLRGRRRSIAVLMSMVGAVLLVSGVALIRYGLSLPRADRAPFISCGMMGSALALCCVWPGTRAALRQPFRRGESVVRS